ncbi:hypothetical protein F2Q69_00056631 [Brassica cretica]|uniref:Uncharacterized protein n=1 Tax=Brassica cretica TaxID=69181 RepID=A0A8S9MWA1_BRACR|nr:hypothetical protein F2Q69_00056631 [Brassica cretica]
MERSMAASEGGERSSVAEAGEIHRKRLGMRQSLSMNQQLRYLPAKQPSATSALIFGYLSVRLTSCHLAISANYRNKRFIKRMLSVCILKGKHFSVLDNAGKNINYW